MLDRIKVNINVGDKLRNALREWNKHPFPSNEDYNRNKKIVIKQLKDSSEVRAEYLEKDAIMHQYHLHLHLGKLKLVFLEDSQLNLTVLYYTDEYEEEVGLVTTKGRPLKLKELFFDKKSNSIEKAEQKDKTCNICGNLNRKTAKFCDKCGCEL